MFMSFSDSKGSTQKGENRGSSVQSSSHHSSEHRGISVQTSSHQSSEQQVEYKRTEESEIIIEIDWDRRAISCKEKITVRGEGDRCRRCFGVFAAMIRSPIVTTKGRDGKPKVLNLEPKDHEGGSYVEWFYKPSKAIRTFHLEYTVRDIFLSRENDSALEILFKFKQHHNLEIPTLVRFTFMMPRVRLLQILHASIRRDNERLFYMEKKPGRTHANQAYMYEADSVGEHEFTFHAVVIHSRESKLNEEQKRRIVDELIRYENEKALSSLQLGQDDSALYFATPSEVYDD
eukprot:TRINITY_DN8571_c0_g2_i1.p1 TRINITY_DN8571_c0_g2~~TRINITY_DN8571_c0_g2_i1.p1  ORF type:complete len:289 (-),score=32.74 TRINITY_DN8571_c0_g2_i1:62-928(-)